MIVSVFTPSHDPTHLREVWRSLQKQTYQQFEWVVAANGSNAAGVEAVVRHCTEDDSRVRVVHSTERNIGAIKKFACSHCVGDLLLELDHDDILTADCLETVVATALTGPRASFIYSDSVTCDFAGTSHRFQAAFGWQQYDFTYDGVTYAVNRMHPLNARSLCEILYSPDHVRVWTKDAYAIAGGHNPAYSVGDDHELLVRTYLAGVHFQHIPKPLYIHRLGNNNTSVTHVSTIQGVSHQTRDKHLHALVAEWCRREKLPMYDLGGAFNSPAGYIPIDKNQSVTEKADGICYDIVGANCRLSSVLPAGRVGCIRAFDFLEHVPADKIPALMNSIYNVLAPGGWLLTMTPAVCDNEGRCGRGAFQDPTHVSFWSSNSFWYYTNKEFAKYVPEIECRFQAVRLGNGYPSEWHKTHLIPYVWADLVAVKGNMYHPGQMFI